MAWAPPVITRKGDQVDNYHGEMVADPYRWLEDTNDPETKRWVECQNEATEAFLAAVPTRAAIPRPADPDLGLPEVRCPLRARWEMVPRAELGFAEPVRALRDGLTR